MSTLDYDEGVLSVLVRWQDLHGVGDDSFDLFLGERLRNVGVDFDGHRVFRHLVTSSDMDDLAV